MILTSYKRLVNIKGDLSGLRQFLASKSPLKLMKKVKYFNLCSEFLVMYSLIRKLRFQIYDTTNWITNNYNKHIAKYLKT